MKANGRGRVWAGRAAIFAALAAGAFWLAGSSSSSGLTADKDDTPAKPGASELALVPADGLAVVSVRFADLWNHAAFKGARDRLVKDAPEFVDEFTKEFGVAPDEVERLTGLLLEPESRGGMLAFVTTTKAYDAQKVLGVFGPKAGAEEGIKQRRAYAWWHGRAVALLDERTLVVGAKEEVESLLKRDAPKDGPLAAALREAAGKHLVVVGVDAETVAKTAPKDLPPAAAALKPLLKARSALLTVDLGDEATAEARLTFAGESDAKEGEEAVNAALDLARFGMVTQLQQVKKEKGTTRIVALLEDVQAGLRAAKVETKGSAVAATMAVKIDPEKTGPDLIDAVQKVRTAATRMNSINNLKQLALAAFNYESTYGHFPANAITDKSGKPLLSWRVAILPYIEQDKLYKEFHLDEPWDSDHNKKLLDKMPTLYGFGDDKAAKNHETHYQGFVGKGAIFNGDKGVKITDVTDGTSNTIMLVEAKQAVPWTKPDDVPFDAGKLAPRVGGLFGDIFNAAMCDGSVRSFPLSIDEDKLRALITINGGEVVDPGK